ncbi:MAG: NADP(H)-dependent aldo-keto reductase [Rickettsiales bacterium]|jgi:aryl-alcohol dehydrogenase-like predicted oxidoreductase|nr:NADP(H)-dependent aldo-keto reductase [Rickettsiales bacterium]MCH2677172.1 NADP(H)-dependent aldo-keto reductase [Alphaproteobacteria bacterium]|tara:strand:- start:1715 stop:2755 length:1041 start_codon:yes stop_codon:yes gene_type:complete
MEFRKLGNTDIDVSLICLGTMTWGEQNSEKEAHEQLDYALDSGINFIDTAELYPVPPKKETQGLTDQYIGNWIGLRKNRDKFILASKVTGRSGMDWFRGSETRLDRDNILQSVEDSLKRLKTDYIDLLQLHWPDRKSNFFGNLDYKHSKEDDFIPLELQLEALAELAKSGKVRYIGLSNETPWGVAKFLELSKTNNLPRIVSVQNPYSLLNRSFEIGLSEIAIRENCGLLAYSPLAFGVLSGKYLGGKKPKGARLTLFGDQFTRYTKERSIQATEEYERIAKKHNLDFAQMSLAFINRQPFLTSNIIGATTMEQLKSNIGSLGISLSEDIISDIETVHSSNPNPSP